LALIEQKPGALDQARPLQGWPLPEQFEHLRRLLEARMGSRGKREFIQVLRLMEVFDKELVAAAVKDAIRLGAPGFDAVKHPPPTPPSRKGSDQPVAGDYSATRQHNAAAPLADFCTAAYTRLIGAA
jgi:hypothetical protein